MVLTKIGDPLEWTELEDPIPDTHGMTLGHEAVDEIYELSELAAASGLFMISHRVALNAITSCDTCVNCQ